jgi:hypothetical protein
MGQTTEGRIKQFCQKIGITVDKYTYVWIAHMRKAWQQYPLIMLHSKVLKRRDEILELNK